MYLPESTENLAVKWKYTGRPARIDVGRSHWPLFSEKSGLVASAARISCDSGTGMQQ